MSEGDIVWRRPEPSSDPPSDYSGPPVGPPPDADWHPTAPALTAAARELPALDHDAVDLAEQRAARVTYTIGFTAFGVLLLLSCWRFF